MLCLIILLNKNELLNFCFGQTSVLHNYLFKEFAGAKMMSIACAEVESVLPSSQMAICKLMDDASHAQLEHLFSKCPWYALAKVPLTTSLWVSMKMKILAHILCSLGTQCCMIKQCEVAHWPWAPLGKKI